MENGLWVWVPSYSRPVTSQKLQCRRFTDSVHHQKDTTPGLDTMLPLSLSPFGDCFYFFQENLKPQRGFEKILNSGKILINHRTDYGVMPIPVFFKVLGRSRTKFMRCKTHKLSLLLLVLYVFGH